MVTMQKITPNLWFDSNAEEAVNYYVSIFGNSSVGKVSHYSKEGFEIHKRPAGSVMAIDFEIEGQRFVAMNGGPVFKFNEAVSFAIACKDQQEIDYFWEKLSAGGDEKAQQCGWLKDKFGVSWQVVPDFLNEMFADADEEQMERVVKAFMPMKKIDIETLKRAYEGDLVKENEGELAGEPEAV